ncbi:TOBE domain-containing protein [Pseudonocardia sp.]|jgi:molybdopterin-binding protein|uniref:TOBE domain-containing protein n=1 Tax=Pseudonocardia sp. TaxID=60912 RepID=UPI003D117955
MARFRISQAADLIGVSDDTVRRHIDTGRLRSSLDESNRKVIDGVDLVEFIRTHNPAPDNPLDVRSSARNRMVGLVTAVTMDTVMAQVEMQCGANRIVSLMSSEAARDLGLEPGSLAVAVVKSTNVTVEVPN